MIAIVTATLRSNGSRACSACSLNSSLTDMFFNVSIGRTAGASTMADHGLARRLSAKHQGLLPIGLVACALLLLPVIPGARWIPSSDTNPTWRILALLTVVLGLPYFLLSTTAPLLQSWFAARWPGTQAYRLFALSNAGALLALGPYPLVIEPRFPTRTQGLAWSW